MLNGIAAVLPIMEAQGSGHIIRTASTGARGGERVYVASQPADVDVNEMIIRTLRSAFWISFGG